MATMIFFYAIDLPTTFHFVYFYLLIHTHPEITILLALFT